MMTFDFDTPKPDMSRASKWAIMDAIMPDGVPDDTLAMWIAQMDFAPAPFLQSAMQRIISEGEYGYFTGLDTFQQRVSWWYESRFGWAPQPEHVMVTHGIGNAIGITLQAMTEPGDGIIIFTPVYHEFTNKIWRNGRTVVESPLTIDSDGLFQMDLSALEAKLDGSERLVLISSPHNPAGRVWRQDELRQLAAFCEKHDLLLVSDEIHQDLVFSGHRQVPTALAVPECASRLIVMSAASKTFDIAGLRTGYVIIPDDDLRARFANLHIALDTQVNRAGLDMTIAAYSEDGARWVDELVSVIEGNAQIFTDGVNAIPGLKAMPMQGTFLAWVDFDGTGMSTEELTRRVHQHARIAPSPGAAFGTGGASCMRFNIGTQRDRVSEAVARLQGAFADLQ